MHKICQPPAPEKILCNHNNQHGVLCSLSFRRDLSKNLITSIEPTDFANFTNLKKLDMSDNSLKKIDSSSFGEILALEKLKLSYNLIVHIFQGAFEKLPMLKQL